MFLLLMRLMIIIFYMSRVFGNVIFDLIKSKILENEEGKAETLAQTSLFTKAKYKNVALETIDSTEIFAWFVTPAEVNEQTQIVLVLHGNNDNRETFCKNYEIENVIDVNNFAFLIVDYRDFGDSKGEFEKDTVVFDVSACLEYLHAELEIDDVDTVAISLGSGILFEYIDSCKLDDKKKDHCLLDKPFSGDVVHSKNTIEKLKSLMTSGGDIKSKAEGKDTARIQRIALVSPIKSIFETVKNMIYLDNLPNIMMGVINKYILTSFAFDNTDKVGYVPKENIKVIHGVKDELISTRQIDEMMEDNPEAVVKIEEGDHASTIKNQTTWSEIFKFFN